MKPTGELWDTFFEDTVKIHYISLKNEWELRKKFRNRKEREEIYEKRGEGERKRKKRRRGEEEKRRRGEEEQRRKGSEAKQNEKN